EEEREIVPDLLLSPESDVEDEFVQKFSHLSIDPIPEIPVPIAEGVPEGEEDQSILLEDFFPPEDTNCTATGMKKMQWRENFYVLKPFATRKVITMSTNPEFESLPKKPKKLFPGKAKKIEKMSSEREDLAGRQIRKTVIEIVLRHLEADPNLEEILSSEELFGFQYIVAPVLIKIDGQKYIASREIPDAVPLDLVTLECFNEEGRYIYEEILLNEWEEILKNLETSEKSLHLCGIRHNDLYFKNILFAQDAQDDTDTGRTYIIDFDKAKIVPNKKESEIKDLETFRRRIAEARYK
ncbi:MAG: lipopolysaccharide kinase InaA family protein, partial [Puniceicoccales bacterium]|nr:lipopolysaccharide kinase InaA family protein [Puniceicoccales bacterium]